MNKAIEIVEEKFQHSSKQVKVYVQECLALLSSFKGDEAKIRATIRNNIDTLQNDIDTLQNDRMACMKYGTTEAGVEANKKLQVWTAFDIYGYKGVKNG